MTSNELDNLARIGKLKKESGTQTEFDGLVNSGRKRLRGTRGTGQERGERVKS